MLQCEMQSLSTVFLYSAQLNIPKQINMIGGKVYSDDLSERIIVARNRNPCYENEACYSLLRTDLHFSEFHRWASAKKEENQGRPILDFKTTFYLAH